MRALSQPRYHNGQVYHSRSLVGSLDITTARRVLCQEIPRADFQDNRAVLASSSSVITLSQTVLGIRRLDRDESGVTLGGSLLDGSLFWRLI